MKIIFDVKVEDYLFDLIEKLYIRNYFKFYENAEQYVDNMHYYIINNIEQKTHYKSDRRFAKIKSQVYYIKFNTTQRTTWYVYFLKDNDRYIILHITNNHVSGHKIIR